jgi:hypothetical protein
MRRLTSICRALVLACALHLAPGSIAVAEEQSFDLRIERGRVSANMRIIRVKQGDVVKLRWTSDRLVALHLHGYDIESIVQPGAIAEMSFTARATGRFTVMRGAPITGGGHTHEAPIVTLEVLPR